MSFWLQTSLSEPNFWLPTLWGQLGLAHPLRLRGVKSADFYPPNSRFQYFLGFFLAWMPWNISTINAWKPGSHCSQKKVQKCHFEIFGLFSFFFQTAVKMTFQTPNKGLTCFKHYKFLVFDEKQLPQNFYSTYLQISLVPCS